MTEVKEIMSSPIAAIHTSDNVANARNLMLRNGISRLGVIDGEGRLKGIVTKKDLAERINQSEPQWRRRPIDKIPIANVMTPQPITIGPDTPIMEAAAIMLDSNISGLIVGKEKPEGIVTKHDLVRYFTKVGCPLRVGDMMSHNVVTVSRHHTINSIINMMEENNVDRVVVTDGLETNAYIGMITLDDLGFVEINPREVKDIKDARKDSAAGRKKYRAVRQVMLVAEDVMASPLIYARNDQKADEAAKIMVENNFDMLPVIDGKILGQFAIENILKWLSEAPE